jgi:iron complex outermembrane receptor protein
MIYRYLLAASLLLPGCLHAQTSPLSGSLRDAHQQPLPFASVVLLTAPDSVVVNGMTTDQHGDFHFDKLPPRAYLLRVSAVGYAPYRQLVTLSAGQANRQLATITLKASAQDLREVVVTGRPPLLQVEGDKLVVNVAASPTQADLNGLEVLAKVPGVTVSRGSEQVLLRNQPPLIMLDDRPVRLSAEQLAQLLRSLRSEDLATIEVIQNPSARYEASGTGGILNIRTKKALRYGSYYTLQAGGAYGYFGVLGSTPQHQQSLTFSRRGGRASVYASLSNVDNYSIGEQGRDQQLLENGQLVTQRQSDDQTRSHLRTQRLTINAELYATPRTTLSVQAQQLWSLDKFSLHGVLRSQPVASPGYELHTDQQRLTRQRYTTLSGQLVHRLDSLGRQLTLSLDGAYLHQELTSDFAYRTYVPAPPALAEQAANHLASPFTSPIFTARADYVQPTRRGLRYEAGTQLTRTDNRNPFSSDFAPGPLRQDYFRFIEVIGSAYGQASGQLLMLKWQAGLRAEQTVANGYDEQGAPVVTRRYLNLMPSASLTRPLGPRQQLTLAYSRRLDRPNYYQYSPFQRFTGRYEYRQGDATLLPFLTHSVSLRHVWKEAVVTTLSYDRATQVYSSYYTLDRTTRPGETLVRTSFTNTTPREVAWYNVNGTVPLDPARWLHLDVSYWYAYRVYQVTVNDTEVNTRVPSFGGSMTATTTLPRQWVLEVAADALSGEAMGAFERSRPATSVDFGLRKTFAHQRATLKLNLSDAFDLYRYRVRYDAPELQALNVSRGTNRLLRLLLTYNLGNANARTSSRSTNVQENTNRSGSDL